MPAPPVDDNVSCWLDELPPYEPGPELRGDHVADVAIIGGGMTGISAAWHLATSGLRVIVLEAKSLANGATGRSGGQLLNGVNGIEPADPETALRLRQVTLAGIAIVEKFASLSTIDCGFRRDGCIEVATTARAAERAQRSMEQMNAWGIPMRWLPANVAGLAGAHGAVLDPDAALMNPAALVRGMRRVLQDLGVAIFENTEVTRVREGSRVELTTAHGRARASSIVLATNAYTPMLGYFREHILPLHSRVVATRPLAEEYWAGLGHVARAGFADDRDRIAYGCRTPDGRMVFGGGANAAYSYLFGGSAVTPPALPSGFAAIERKLAAYFPALVEAGGASLIQRRWSGPLAVTFDRVCSMGVRGVHRNVFYSLGYSGHGLALAALAGRVLGERITGNHDDWRDLPFYQRRLPWIPPEPLRWMGYHAYTRFTGRSPRRR